MIWVARTAYVKRGVRRQCAQNTQPPTTASLHQDRHWVPPLVLEQDLRQHQTNADVRLPVIAVDAPVPIRHTASLRPATGRSMPSRIPRRVVPVPPSRLEVPAMGRTNAVAGPSRSGGEHITSSDSGGEEPEGMAGSSAVTPTVEGNDKGKERMDESKNTSPAAPDQPTDSSFFAPATSGSRPTNTYELRIPAPCGAETTGGRSSPTCRSALGDPDRSPLEVPAHGRETSVAGPSRPRAQDVPSTLTSSAEGNAENRRVQEPETATQPAVVSQIRKGKGKGKEPAMAEEKENKPEPEHNPPIAGGRVRAMVVLWANSPPKAVPAVEWQPYRSEEHEGCA
ncbi:hypothetical protein B0H10DRAFT_2002754 [Mycena sp. CBHHK59/15]|nr:hypothetical protein B0H10DRAFT_2002754 [Mycena sp. CBHHK59/15]